LAESGAPCVFVTGHGNGVFPPAYRRAIVVGKPYQPEHLLGVLAGVLKARPSA
jgi:hypothetical protein